MSAENPDLDPPIGGREAENEPAFSFWWTLLIFLAGCLPLVLMARGLHLVLDLPKDSELVRPALLIVVIIAIVTRPRTFRQRAIVVAVGVSVGAVAMLCFLPFTIFAQDFEIGSRRLMLRVLGMVVLAVLGSRIAQLACRRLAVPLWETRADGSSNPDAP